MRLDELDYNLPEELVAHRPVRRRDHARLLVIDRRAQSMVDRHFYDLSEYLKPGDVLVVNDTKVIPARLTLTRKTGGRLDALFVRELEFGRWELMIRGIGKLKGGEVLRVNRSETVFRFLERVTDKSAAVTVQPPVASVEFLNQFGAVPLPPYIDRANGPFDDDRQWYQTVYSKTPGAVAAPTAGLHFTDDQFDQLRSIGVGIVPVTLHVGPGTFEPISAGTLAEHKMDREWFSVCERSADRINAARHAGARIAAVGTTTLRVLESARRYRRLQAGTGWTDLFIYPPYEFEMVDAMVTNFHLPRTTLLALIYAFAGTDLARQAYRHAIEARYRFYSYGDAMLIL